MSIASLNSYLLEEVMPDFTGPNAAAADLSSETARRKPLRVLKGQIRIINC